MNANILMVVYDSLTVQFNNIIMLIISMMTSSKKIKKIIKALKYFKF